MDDINDLVERSQTPPPPSNVVGEAESDSLGRGAKGRAPPKEYSQFFYVANPSLKYGYESKHIQLMRHQQFNKIYFDPSLGRTRLLINHSTGSGKTKTTIMIAEEYIRHYRQLPSAPQVFILNYNRDVYIDTLMKTPDFGYVSQTEIIEVDRLHKRYLSTELPEDYSAWRNYYLVMRNRISNKQIGGYYKFHGYLDFANKLGFNMDPPQINQIFLDSLRGSLIIADEFQNTYNSDELNVAGEALKYVLDYYQNNIYFIGASWTPISNSPTEIIDVLRLFTGKQLQQKEIFTTDLQLKAGAVDAIKRALTGVVSYYYSLSTENYPDFEFIGEDIPGIDFRGLGNVYNFKFIRCEPKGEYLRALTTYGLNVDEMHISDHVLRDMVLPGGIYKTLEVKVSPTEVNQAIDDIDNYSAKYARLLKDLPKMKGKVLIFHDYVQSSGITFIERLIRRRLGYISGREMTELTPCYLCGIPQGEHKKAPRSEHEYHPARYNMIHSDLDDLEVRNNFRFFNAPTNNMGQEIKVQLGSHKILTSFDYKQVSHLVCLSFPTDFSSLTQLVGRVIRTGAGIGMPPGWKVQLHIYVNSNSLEENIYKRKFKMYIPITQINNAIKDVAVDKDLNTELPPDELANIKEESFFGYGLYKTEALIIERLIMAALNEAPQYTYNDLWEWVRNPPIRVDINTKIISEDLFVFVLTELVNGGKINHYGEYYMFALRDFAQPVENEFDINTIDIDNLMRRDDDISPNIFRQYEPSVHLAVVRALIMKPEKNKKLFNFYRRLRIIEGTSSYIDPSFKSIHTYSRTMGEFQEEFFESPPPINHIFGYYEDGNFKLINLKKREAEAYREDRRHFHRGLACKSIKMHELEKIADALGVRRSASAVMSICTEIENILINKHIEAKEKIFFGFLGNISKN